MNETIRTIRERRSIRAYQPQQVDDNALQQIVLAGQFAPTAMGLQPWHFTVLQHPEKLEQLQRLCKEVFLHSDNAALREAASRDDYHLFYHAPTLILVSGDAQATAPMQDCVLAMENMLLAATSLGISSCWVHSPIMLCGNAEGASAFTALELGIPSGYQPYAAAVFGYSAMPLPEAAPRKSDIITIVR